MTYLSDLQTPKIKSKSTASKVPQGVYTQCPYCKKSLQTKLLKAAHKVCWFCHHPLRMTAQERIALLTNDFEPYAKQYQSVDPLSFKDLKDYSSRLEQLSKQLKIPDGIIAGRARLKNIDFHLAVFEFKFMGGSMGCVVGELITQVFENAYQEKLPAVVVCASGGARMQEGILSLMQMAKTTAALSKLRQASIPYISILTDPTTGGVAASFAMLGDIILAEPKALIGFTGPRVIEQTLRQVLPEGFQRSEFLLEHGFIDRIVERKFLAEELYFWMWQLGRQKCRFAHSS